MRAHYDEDNVRAALLLEQSAYAQVRGWSVCHACVMLV
jgi:hypothetical protein